MKLYYNTLYTLFLCLVFSIPAEAARDQGVTFLIQNRWGGIVGFALSDDLKTSEPEIVRPPGDANEIPSIIDLEIAGEKSYQVTSNGRVIPIGETRLPDFFWHPLEDCKGFALTKTGDGGWFISKNHLVGRGNRPDLVFPVFDEKKNIVDIEFDPTTQRLVILFENGEIIVCTRNNFVSYPTIELKNDRAMDIEINPSEFYVLTYASKVYQVTKQDVREFPLSVELGEGLSRDMELSPFRQGFYILTAFGDIHALAGAPPIKTVPLARDLAVDLEWIPGDTIPRWFPTGWNTEISFKSESVTLDPEGPPKMISLYIENAENLSLFRTQLHYDPDLISIDPKQVRAGVWWRNNARDAPVQARLDKPNGNLTLQSGSTFFAYDGASGNGELVRFAIAPAGETYPATTTLELNYGYFRVASPVNDTPMKANVGISSCTVRIAPVQPVFDVAWSPTKSQSAAQTEERLSKGDVFQVEMRVEEGSRIKKVEFDYRFSRDTLKFIGMTMGSAWNPEIPVIRKFTIPQLVNKQEIVKNQQIIADQSGACRDEKSSMVILFFEVIQEGEIFIEFPVIKVKGHKGQELKLDMLRNNITIK